MGMPNLRQRSKTVNYSALEGDEFYDEKDDPAWEASKKVKVPCNMSRPMQRSQRWNSINSNDESIVNPPARRSQRLRMKEWLVQQIDSGHYNGLKWLDTDHTIVQIPWKHGSRQGWNINDFCLFRNWAIYTGKYNLKAVPNPKKWKANFRCALNSLPNITEESARSHTKGSGAFKVYRIISVNSKPKRKTHVKRRKASKSFVNSDGEQFDIGKIPGIRYIPFSTFNNAKVNAYRVVGTEQRICNFTPDSQHSTESEEFKYEPKVLRKENLNLGGYQQSLAGEGNCSGVSSPDSGFEEEDIFHGNNNVKECSQIFVENAKTTAEYIQNDEELEEMIIAIEEEKVQWNQRPGRFILDDDGGFAEDPSMSFMTELEDHNYCHQGIVPIKMEAEMYPNQLYPYAHSHMPTTLNLL